MDSPDENNNDGEEDYGGEEELSGDKNQNEEGEDD